MSTFRFNFSGADDDNKLDETKETIEWLESEEIVPDKQIKNLDSIVIRAKMFACGDVEIGHVVVSEAMASIEESGLKNVIELAEKEHSDLVAGKYEGGLKIWECTYDLIQYLEENLTGMKFENSNVLDLGCGAGILGIYAFLHNSKVTFQDYNKEVLEHLTIPNVLLNIEEEEDREKEIQRCKFYSGDWDSFNQKLPRSEVFDIILTSETIYNDSNYEKLIKLFVDRLSKVGAAYVAAKTYYFGVGGGVRQFEQNITKNGHLTSTVCWKSEGGIQREILKITKLTE
ncbi:histidine protein methyltransferase 1 homolog [Helicoverpa zea]|uniref:histidine protein methyltransferase 1 homolog n=1 Tax=Helicoverpa zea TaxID=7113 RepID=UPI001F59FC56|nr:histidine protein methyltransferase 1 homolog [Helicoverpa zea]